MKLKELRIKSGLKAYKVAEILGVSRAQLYNIENGKSAIDINKIEKFSQLYCKSIDEIKRAMR